MNNKKHGGKKLVVLLTALVLIFGLTIGGTVAWLATATNPLENVFTTGDINITLTEPNYKPNADGKFKFMPGDVFDKDPTVTVLAGSEPCYVRLFMVLRWTDAADGWFGGKDAEDWFDFNTTDFRFVGSYIDDVTGETKVNIYEIRYIANGGIVTADTDDAVLPALFTKISLPKELTGDKYASLANSKVEILAQAVQSTGFNSADAAFAAAGTPKYIADLINQYYPDSNN